MSSCSHVNLARSWIGGSRVGCALFEFCFRGSLDDWRSIGAVLHDLMRENDDTYAFPVFTSNNYLILFVKPFPTPTIITAWVNASISNSICFRKYLGRIWKVARTTGTLLLA